MRGFEVIPAIDLVEGKVVRLERGELARKTVYGDDPVAVAERWTELGARRLHVVDLEGAVAGEPRHHELIGEIARSAGVPVQVGGGIRTLEHLTALLGAGVDRVVVGTAALGDPSFLPDALRLCGGGLVVSLDVRGREVRAAGWTEGTGEEVVAAAQRLAAEGVRRFMCTDIARDGMLAGPNVELLTEVAEAAGVPVLASGGVSSTDDIRRLVALASRGIEGVIVGRALYTGDLELADALTVTEEIV